MKKYLLECACRNEETLSVTEAENSFTNQNNPYLWAPQIGCSLCGGSSSEPPEDPRAPAIGDADPQPNVGPKAPELKPHLAGHLHPRHRGPLHGLGHVARQPPGQGRGGGRQPS